MARKHFDDEDEWGNDFRDGKRNRYSEKEERRNVRRNIERNRNDYLFSKEDAE